jgi:MerR family transcriptional regulator, thiopeptide resistance regulator
VIDLKDEKLFTVGEIAKKCNISVRTLQFYDKNGLVSPGMHSEGGRRLYGMPEILRLQQVLFLKSFGFTLEEIRDKLMPIQTVGEIANILKAQDETLTRQINYLMEASTLIKQTLTEVERNGDIPMSNLMAIMSAVQRGHSYAFVLKYFGKKELDTMVSELVNQPNPFDQAKKWQEMIERLVILHQKGVDPEGEQGQLFAAEWWTMIEDISQNNPDFLKSAISAGEDVDNWPDDAGGFKAAIKNFIGLAIGKYVKDKGIMLP